MWLWFTLAFIGGIAVGLGAVLCATVYVSKNPQRFAPIIMRQLMGRAKK